MKKNLLLGTLLCISVCVSAQFTFEFTNYNSTNTPAFSGNNFKCIWVGKGNRIWAGTQYQGLYWFDTARKAWTKSSQLTNVFINQIQNDKDGGIWIAQSGTSGLVGGGSNTGGGINYFPDTTDAGMQFYTTSSFLSSRNVRGVYLDTVNTPEEGKRRIWVPQATFTTSGNTAAGGVTRWQYLSPGFFNKVSQGLQIFPNTNTVSSGTPSCYTTCGDRDEVWVGAETNYTIATGSTTQILRYDAVSGQHLGGWDQNGAFDATRLYYNNQARVYTGDSSTVGILPAGFRTTAMYCDREGRRWIGFRSGGVVVKTGSTWKAINMPSIIPAGTMINFNAITSDEFGYIYIGTSAGLVIFDNGGDVTDTTFYKRLTTDNGLPSNNITGVAYDKAGGKMLITSDAGVTFMKYNYRIRVDMEWDYSFPYRFNQPVGVAADGVSRIYLKVRKRSDTLPDIKEVSITLKDYTGIDNNLRGKLKKALVTDRYSEEASTGTSSTVTISNAEVRPGLPGEFWFWYVAPDDFSGDSTGEFSNLSRRFEKMIIIATYADNKKDTQEYKIGIVRPPTLFVHGLASSPGAWDLLEHLNNGQFTKFVNSPLFVYKRALTMDPIGYFHKNGAQLLGADASAYQYTGDRLNTLQGNIEAMRNDMRYAANQVDYVCHSMGGIMIRSAIGFFPQKFYSGTGDTYIFKTYKKGYTHKIITINTPHNGAPIADVLDQFIPLTPTVLNYTLNLAYYEMPVLIGGFFKPVGTGVSGTFKATDAVNNLQVTAERGGVNMLKTTNKFHMICGDLDWNSNYVEAFNIGTINYALAKIYKTLIQTMYAATYNSEEMDQATAEQTRAYLRELMAKPYETMIADFLNWMAHKRGYENYLADSDLIVPLMSQTAQITIPQSYISVFKPTDMGLGTQGLNANHSAILWRHDVGQRVFQLLNSKMTSDLFGDEIPVDDDPEPPALLRPSASSGNAGRPISPSAIGISYDTAKIKIDAPLMNTGVNADSTITVKFRLKDTMRLAYVSINFQGEDSFKMKKIFTQQSVTFKADRSHLGNSKVFAYAVYDNATGTGVDFHVDSVVLNAASVAPLQGFRIKEEVINMTAGTPYMPAYEVQYNNEWVALANNDPGIAIAIDSVNTVSYDTTLKTFNGLKEGGAVANFTYNGFTDSVLIKVILPYNYNCINKTLASGSLKNPAIWSKGTVPDVCDSVVISTGHTVTTDTSVIIRSLLINSGGTLVINNAAYTLQLGQADEGSNTADNYGTLNISNGNLYINGRIKHNAASSFIMSGGTLTIDGNKGVKEMSIPDGVAIFEAAAGMTSFNFSGGTLQINNPPFGAASQALNCLYDFGNNSTLVLGINTSTTAGQNADGFGGLSFPNKIGRLIVNAGTRNGNRQFVNKKALTVKGNAEVRTGSGIVIQAPITVNQ